MLKNAYMKFLFLISFITYHSSTHSNTINYDSNEHSALHEAEAIKEIKKQLNDIYNYIIINNYVPDADKISPFQMNEIIEEILNKDDIKNTLLSIIMIQLELKEQNKINTQYSIFNNELNFFTSIGLYSSLITLVASELGKKSEYTIVNACYILTKGIFYLSAIGQIIHNILKNKLKSKRAFISKTGSMLQEKKMEINSTLVNLLINALQEAVKSNI